MTEVSTLAKIGRLNCSELNNSELWSTDIQRAPRAMNAEPILLIDRMIAVYSFHKPFAIILSQ